MKTSILENLPLIKDTIRQYAQAAEKNGWITNEEYQKAIRHIDEDQITIGVIGQMKSGKSTFLNALLFEKDVLPAASTPMTASLTEITFGDTPSVEAEFYTPEEWTQIKMTSEAPFDNTDKRKESEVKAAKELVEKSRVLGGELDKLLGTKKAASFNELLNFVGADGKYVAITKAAKIMYPLDILKGVQIVDTPGFNDPVVSRERRSVEFLAKADVVILLLYSGRAFDETDRDIIFEKVRNVGVGKIIIAVNKYDVDIENGELEEDIQNGVKEQIRKALRKKNDDILNKLLDNVSPVLFSAYMALLAKKPLAEINANETEKFHYNRLSGLFEIQSQDKLYEKSRLDLLKTEIDNLLRKEKVEILVNKSLNEISAKIDTKRTELEKTIAQLEQEIKTLSLNPEELGKRQHDCERAKKKIERTISGVERDVNEFIYEKKEKTIKDLVSLRTKLVREMKQCVGKAKNGDEAMRNIDRLTQDFRAECLEIFASLRRVIKTELKTLSQKTISELDEIIARFSGDEEKSEDYTNTCRDELDKFNDLTLEDIFVSGNEKNTENTDGGDDLNLFDKIFFGTANVINTVYSFATLGLWGKFTDWLRWKEEKKEFLNTPENELVPEIDAVSVYEPVKERVEEYIGFFRQRFQTDLIDVISAQIKNAQDEFSSREQNKKASEEKLAKAQADKKQFEEQAAKSNEILSNLQRYIK